MSAAAPWQPPKAFDEYRILKPLGSGSMGQVYLAQDTLLDRLVAVKVIAGGTPDAEQRERFQLEARAIARVQHPNVVEIYRAGEVQGRPYLISAFVRGQSLDQLTLPLPWERVLGIAIDLASGLAAAHRKNVLHRDIKLANAMVTVEGQVKLLDFGVAKLVDLSGGVAWPVAVASSPLLRALPGDVTVNAAAPAGVPVTPQPPLSPLSPLSPQPSPADAGVTPPLEQRTGLVGTPRYMSPEAWRQEPATPRSDLYSLGVVLYELCTGAGPHQATNLGALSEAIQARDAPPLARRVAGVNPAFAALVDRCLARDPEQRFPSADALREALEALRADRGQVGLRERPYPGLHAFSADDRSTFFGRDTQARAVLDRLRGEPLVLVAGDSGAGKSSLCRADVLPRVADGALGGGGAWAVCELLPGRHPLQALAAALAPLLEGGEDQRPAAEAGRAGGEDQRPAAEAGRAGGEDQRPAAEAGRAGGEDQRLAAEAGRAGGEDQRPSDEAGRAEGERLSDVLSGSPREVGRWVLARVRARGALVFVDQLEELLTLAEPGELEAFTAALRSLASSGPRLRVLATARGDFLARLAELPGLGEHLSGGLYLLPHLGEAGLREAITGPARSQDYTFENEALIGALVAAGHADGGLPLLQFALAELWERRDRVRRTIPAEALAALGGVDGALARHADGVLAALRPGPRTAARHLLLRLVLADGTRARRTLPELVGEVGPEGGEARVALEALVRGRLVIARESPDGEATYELAHEALVRGWDTLRGWLASDQELRAIRHRLERACAEWERLGRPREQLWGRRQLREASALDRRGLTPPEAAFLAASRGAARGRVALLAAAALVIPSSIAGTAWWTNERQVADLVADADRAVAVAESKRQAVEELRSAAFGAFDGAREDAEELWARARKLGAEQAEAYDEAIAILERALVHNEGRPELRHRMARAIFGALAVAERDHDRPMRALLQRRLGLYDDAGEYQDRLREPALVDVETQPPGARVHVEQAVEQEDGPLRAMRWVALPQPSGTTPLAGMSLPPGSYRLRLSAPDRPDVLYPVLVARGDRLRVRVPVPARVPEGYAYVAPGRYLRGSADDEETRRMIPAPPIHPVALEEGFLIARREVTHGEWLAFLRALPAAERAQRRPHGGNYFGDLAVEEAKDGRWEIAIQRKIDGVEHAYRFREGERFVYQRRQRRADQDWLRFPVSSISWEDAQAYLAWLDATGRLPGARLCTRKEWEIAARGADGREFPSGNALAPDDANFDLTYGRVNVAFGPDEVGSHPASDSPFGVSDMAGNVWEWVRHEHRQNPVAYVGGGFYQSMRTSRSVNWGPGETSFRWPFIGLRACAPAPAP